jgi:mono/diheme cytochrome c family protein
MRLPRLGTVVLIAVGLFALIQLVPYGRAHDNPMPTASPRWDSPRTEKLFQGACGDCHSFRTTWPWYSQIAPSSWLVQNDVDGGREVFNVSEWDQPQPDVGEVVEQIDSGEMPPLQFKAIHGEARLSASEKDELIRGVQRTWANDPPGGGAP